MPVWRPPSVIKVKVIGVARQGARFLAAEVQDDAGRVKGVRPLGGSIEFGETREQALAREFREELQTETVIRGPWTVFENIYGHEDARSHEFIFAAEIDLLDRSLYERETIPFVESDGESWLARWFDLATLDAQGLALYPPGLETILSV